MNNQFSNNSKNLKMFLILIGVALMIIVGVLGSLKLNDKQSENLNLDDIKSNEELANQFISNSAEFEKDGVSFSYPAEYKINDLEKGYTVIFKEGESIPSEAGINIDTRHKNEDFVKIVNEKLNHLEKPTQKQIPNGVKMYGEIKEGLGKGIPTLFAVLEINNQIIIVEHSGEILNEAVFDQILSSIIVTSS